jgi:predicted nucleic-acid-binding protein
MIAIDTNILVRYAVKDDKRQTVLATDFMANNECMILKSVLLELDWVLSSPSGYGLSRKAVVERVRHILGLPTINCENAFQVAQALRWYEHGMDFADALHLASSAELDGFATLDGKMARKAAELSNKPKLIHLD